MFAQMWYSQFRMSTWMKKKKCEKELQSTNQKVFKRGLVFEGSGKKGDKKNPKSLFCSESKKKVAQAGV